MFQDNNTYSIARFVRVFDTNRRSNNSNCHEQMLEDGHFDFTSLGDKLQRQ